MLRWILKEIWEKINLPQVYRDLKKLGKKHGRRFFIAALIWEVIEDVVFPFIAWKCGVPGLIPVFLVLHFEPIVYPAFFWGFRMWDRAHGKEPWEPSRAAQSAYWRSIVKGVTFQAAVSGWLSHVLPWKTMVIFIILTSLFGFIHERIWHDTNYGIVEYDTVKPKRAFAKTGTYLLFSAFTLYPLLKVAEITHLWHTLFLAQGITACLYLLLETVWAKSLWGIAPTNNPSTDTDEDKS
jgi:hypothetical protein